MEQGSEELGPATPLLSGYDTTHAPPNTPARGAPEPPIGLAQAVLCSVFRAPREYNREEYSDYSGRRVSTAEYVSSRALVGRQ